MAAPPPRTSGRANRSTSLGRDPRRGAERPRERRIGEGQEYLIGSYPLRFDTSAKIAFQLVQMQLEGRAPDWLVERNREFAAVSLATLKRAAERVFGDGALYTTVVGKPEGF